jgi:hypothetical protein
MADQDATAGLPSPIEDMISGADGLPLPPAVKRSLWKAVGRLIGSVADLGVAAVETGTTRIEARTDAVKATAEARRTVKLEMAKKVPDMIAAHPALANRAVAFLGHEMLVEQANRERILEHAIEDLRSAPPREHSAREIDDDWLHAFVKEASIKSAPEMRLLFGRILSGEIKTPGSFSLKTIRVLSMMNQATAQQFEMLCNRSVVIGEHTMMISDPTISLLYHDLTADILNNLNDNDLIHSDFEGRRRWKLKIGELFDYAGNAVWLDAKLGNETMGKIGCILFSTAGKELRQIVFMQPDPDYTSALVSYFEAQGCDLMKATGRRGDGTLTGKPYRDLI